MPQRLLRLGWNGRIVRDDWGRETWPCPSDAEVGGDSGESPVRRIMENTFVPKPTPEVTLHGRTMTSDMAEISGFGGSYEEGCRLLVLAGVEWILTHPEAKPEWKVPQNIIGIDMENNADAEALEAAMMAAPITKDGRVTTVGEDCTGAMMQFSKRHAARAAMVGWDVYVAESKALRAQKSPEDDGR